MRLTSFLEIIFYLSVFFWKMAGGNFDRFPKNILKT